LFYRLLLAGKRVEPNLPLETYVEMSGGKGALLPLPAPEVGVDVAVTPPPPPAVDEDLVLGIPDPPRARKRAAPGDNPLEEELASPKAKPKKPAPRRVHPPVEPPAPVPIVAPPVVEPGPGGGGGGGGGGGDAPPIAIPEPDDEDLVVGVPVAMPEPRAAKRAHNVVDAIGGGWVKFDMYHNRKRKAAYPNYTLSCLTCPAKNKCKKTKGAWNDVTKKEERIETLAYLHAWRTTPVTDPGKTHARHEPEQADADGYLEAHRAELQALVDKCKEPEPAHG